MIPGNVGNFYLQFLKNLALHTCGGSPKRPHLTSKARHFSTGSIT